MREFTMHLLRPLPAASGTPASEKQTKELKI